MLKAIFRKHHNKKVNPYLNSCSSNDMDTAAYHVLALKEVDTGFKGLKKALQEKYIVRLIVSSNTDEQLEIEGRISHYDDTYRQLVLLTQGALKRFVFDEIIEVKIV